MKLEHDPQNEKTTDSSENRFQVSSAAKRLFALLIDFIIALLLANTLEQISRQEHWDLAMQNQDWSKLIPFYGGIVFVLLFKDIFGRSPGKLLLGMTIRQLQHLDQPPSAITTVQRNALLFLLPVEGVVLLRDSYARRLADQWTHTIVLDDPNAMRVTMRLLLGNIIMFGFFAVAIFSQRSGIEKTAAFQTSLKAIRSHEPLQPILEKAPEIEEPEMHLDLRAEGSQPSLLRARIGDEDTGKEVTVSLRYRSNPPGWEVVKVDVKPIRSE